MTDAPKTIAEMREAAAAAYDSIADPLLNEPCAFKRSCFRAGWDAAIRALPLPADDAEIMERVMGAMIETFPSLRLNYDEQADLPILARVALSAMRGNQ